MKSSFLKAYGEARKQILQTVPHRVALFRSHLPNRAFYLNQFQLFPIAWEDVHKNPKNGEAQILLPSPFHSMMRSYLLILLYSLKRALFFDDQLIQLPSSIRIDRRRQ